MISYGAVSLSVHSPEDDLASLGVETLSAWLREHLDPRELFEDTPRCWPGRALTHLGFRPPLPMSPVDVGVLRWPWGASRFAVGHFLATGGQLDRIRPLVYGSSGSAYNALPLVLDDSNTGRSLTASLWMLPPRPLAAVPGANGLSLLTLVDDRFFWWFIAASISVTGGTTTWEQLYAAIGTALGVTIAVDAIPAAYLKPSASLGVKFQALPLLLDAVAVSVGQRIVRTPGGTVRAMNASAARTLTDGQKASWPVVSGGEFLLSPG